jgi:hypothetical protein
MQKSWTGLIYSIWLISKLRWVMGEFMPRKELYGMGWHWI